VVLFAVALAWRLVVLVRLGQTPLLEFLSADAEAYWGWASEIRSGRVWPTHAFFLGPLYAYWLAVVRSFVGDEIAGVLPVQSALGAAAVVLVTDATRRIATPRAAVAVGIALAGYAMTVYFDAMVLMESLLFLLMSLTLWLIVRDDRRSSILVGAVIGFMALGRPVAILLVVPYGIHLATRRSRRLRSLAGLCLIPAAITLATGAHHVRTAGAWIPLTYSGGYNFYVGNGPEANGTYVPFADEHVVVGTEGEAKATVGDGRAFLLHTLGLRLSPGASSRHWYELAMADIVAEPMRFARLFVLKLGLLWNHRELPQLSDEAAYDRIAGPLGWPPWIVFPCLVVLGGVGVPVAWGRGGRYRVVVGILATLTVATATFFVVDRYRVHLIPPLAMLAGLGIVHMGSLWRSRDPRGAFASLVVIAAAFGIVFAPLIPTSPVKAEWSHASTFGEAWLANGEPAQAVRWFEAAVAIDESGRLPASTTRSSRLSRAGVYENLGICYALLGDDARAAAALATAVELASRSPSTRARYAEALAMTGAWAAAEREYRAAGLSPTGAAESIVRRAAREARGSPATRKALEAAAGMAPSYERAVIPLVRLEITEGRLNSARIRLRGAEANGIDPHLVRAHLAWIAALEGDPEGSRRLADAIPAAVRTSDPRIAATLEQVKASVAP
jgi:hypothetical protein